MCDVHAIVEITAIPRLELVEILNDNQYTRNRVTAKIMNDTIHSLYGKTPIDVQIVELRKDPSNALTYKVHLGAGFTLWICKEHITAIVKFDASGIYQRRTPNGV